MNQPSWFPAILCSTVSPVYFIIIWIELTRPGSDWLNLQMWTLEETSLSEILTWFICEDLVIGVRLTGLFFAFIFIWISAMQTCRLIDSQKCWKIPNIWVNYWIWCYQNITKTGTNNCYFTVFESQQFKLNCFRFALQKIIVKLLNTLSCLSVLK